MSPERRMDREDPFGSLLDEKPPEGWDDQFIEEVRRKIETRGEEPESGKLPEAPRPKRKSTVATLAGVIALSAALSAFHMTDGTESTLTEPPAPTVVTVDGSRQPDVAVEWASRAGHASDVVVLQSFSPEISYLQEVPSGEGAVQMASSSGAVHPSSSASGHVLVQLFRGDRKSPFREVSTTTIFRDSSSLIPVDDVPIGAEEDLRAQMQVLYELETVSSLGTSVVSLSGGMAVVNTDGNRIRIQMKGQVLADRTVRLLIHQQHEGMEDTATSVVARYGRTFMLSGSVSAGHGSDTRPLFVFLTPYPSFV